MRRKKKNKSSYGFTLIELLVVISIISALIAITLPCLRLCRIKAKSIQCVSNIRNLMIAWQSYASQNNGNIISGDIQGPGTKSWVQLPQDDKGNVTSEKPFAKSTVHEQINGVKKGALYSHLENIEVYRCPEDKKVSEQGIFPTYFISAPMNGEPPIQNDVDLRVKKLSEICRPSEKLVFVERGSWFPWHKRSWMMNHKFGFWKDPVAIMHNNKGSLAFADGHCEIHKWKDKRTIEMAKSNDVLQIHTDSCDFEFMHKAYNPNTN